MEGPEDEFEEFLKRRKPVFRAPDDMFEPPAELDRVVLRQAREAIATERPLKVFRGPRWTAPVALAATLLLAVTIIFQAAMPPEYAPVPEVTVQNVAERVEIPAADTPKAAPNSAVADSRAREAAPASDAVMVDLATPMAAKRESAAGSHAAPPPPAAPMVAARPSASTSMQTPAWRRDSKTWLAEIDRLRDAGDIERAEAELAEYKRQQRAYAVGPDR